MDDYTKFRELGIQLIDTGIEFLLHVKKLIK